MWVVEWIYRFFSGSARNMYSMTEWLCAVCVTVYWEFDCAQWYQNKTEEPPPRSPRWNASSSYSTLWICVFVYCVISVMCVFLCVYVSALSVWVKCRESCSTFARRERLIVHTHSTRAWQLYALRLLEMRMRISIYNRHKHGGKCTWMCTYYTVQARALAIRRVEQCFIEQRYSCIPDKRDFHITSRPQTMCRLYKAYVMLYATQHTQKKHTRGIDISSTTLRNAPSKAYGQTELLNNSQPQLATSDHYRSAGFRCNVLQCRLKVWGCCSESTPPRCIV